MALLPTKTLLLTPSAIVALIMVSLVVEELFLKVALLAMPLALKAQFAAPAELKAILVVLVSLKAPPAALLSLCAPL